MKKFLLIVFLVACTQVMAQEKSPDSYLGFKVALNYTSNSISNPDLEGVEVNYKTGFAGGFFCNIGVVEKFSIQPEFMYSQMGSEFEETNVEGAPTTTLALNYFSVPLLFKFRPFKKLGIFLGPQLDVLQMAKANYSNAANQEIEEQFVNSDIGGTIGVEYWFNNYLGIYARYMMGFTDVSEKNPGIDLTAQTVNSEISNNGFQIGLALGFRHKESGEVEVFPLVAPTDSDGDGVIDNNDKCPNQAGLAKYDGCPVPDGDGDGINDETDKCPTQAGTAKYNGCPVPDTDGDGVNDESDRCPKTAGIANNMGCPEMILYYQREEAGIDSSDMSNLDIVVAFMNRHPDLSIIVEGHTSTPGEDAFNLSLSQKRAQDAVDYMVSKGVDRSRMTPKGLGEQFPVGDNSTDEGRAKSRRVVIKIAQ